MACENVSIVIPCKNEAGSLVTLLTSLKEILPNAEIIVVNDGSSDNTSEICKNLSVVEVKHAYSRGNGAAIKSGVRQATRDILVLMDGDGQHDPADIPRLMAKFQEGYDMVVGSRDSKSQASFGRLAANRFYNKLASWMVGYSIKDLTSGFRITEANKFKEFLYLLPNGFSYPTTSTMAFFRAGYSVYYEPIVAAKRLGKSHINLTKDGIRFLLIIFKVGTLYSPLKLFVPISAILFMLGLGYYGYTYIETNRFTNMSALLFSTSLTIFLLGLISEQITALIYRK